MAQQMSQEVLSEKDDLQLIVFKLGNEEYTVPIMTVQEIIMPETATKLPKTPAFIEGIINLRGKIIPVIDGRKRLELGYAEATHETRIMILELKTHTIGIIVDSVSEVIHLSAKDIEMPPVELAEKNTFLNGVGKYKGRLLILLEPAMFLEEKEIESLKTMAKFAQNMAQKS